MRAMFFVINGYQFKPGQYASEAFESAEMV